MAEIYDYYRNPFNWTRQEPSSLELATLPSIMPSGPEAFPPFVPGSPTPQLGLISAPSYAPSPATCPIHNNRNKSIQGVTADKLPLLVSEYSLKPDQTESTTDLKEYQSAIGSLLFTAIITRPDILRSVCYPSQFLSVLSESHMRMVKNIFQYLAHTINYKLTYHYRKDALLSIHVVYSDSTYANFLSNRWSFAGSITIFAGGPIAWSCAKQGVVALSTTESEPVLYRDTGNPSSYFLTRHPSLYWRSKHIDVGYVRAGVTLIPIFILVFSPSRFRQVSYNHMFLLPSIGECVEAYGSNHWFK